MARLLRAFNKYARFYALTLVVLTLAASLHIGACLICSTLEICEESFLVDLDNTNSFSWESNDNLNVCSNEGVYHLYAEAIYVTFTLLIGMSATGGLMNQDSWVKSNRGVSITQAVKSQSWAGGEVSYLFCVHEKNRSMDGAYSPPPTLTPSTSTTITTTTRITITPDESRFTWYVSV